MTEHGPAPRRTGIRFAQGGPCVCVHHHRAPPRLTLTNRALIRADPNDSDDWGEPERLGLGSTERSLRACAAARSRGRRPRARTTARRQDAATRRLLGPFLFPATQRAGAVHGLGGPGLSEPFRYRAGAQPAAPAGARALRSRLEFPRVIKRGPGPVTESGPARAVTVSGPSLSPRAGAPPSPSLSPPLSLYPLCPCLSLSLRVLALSLFRSLRPPARPPARPPPVSPWRYSKA